jgi:protein involved in sex pheromone biosynthesis
MKNTLILLALGVAFTLSACGKSDVEKQVEIDKVNQKQSGGSLDRIRKIVVTPDNAGSK